ncbi:hypothetical protein PR202_gb29452 [Eleusine coracana subsp. coracana]|uniref:Uncharacterized protein n=1 Tax=Eleusine coracana subsp. coracana TaxID=191504 RepID=A0AAV5FZC2_ELECO|nr:hypothetical protein PR202_gb29452 [Eleusine coracana subsp. coracana]
MNGCAVVTHFIECSPVRDPGYPGGYITAAEAATKAMCSQGDGDPRTGGDDSNGLRARRADPTDGGCYAGRGGTTRRLPRQWWHGAMRGRSGASATVVPRG